MTDEVEVAPGPEAYANYIQEERDWLAKNREKYTEMLVDVPKKAIDILGRILLRVGQCNAETTAEKSHWTMGQIREIAGGWDKELGLIGKFEKSEARIKKWDIEQAAKNADR